MIKLYDIPVGRIFIYKNKKYEVIKQDKVDNCFGCSLYNECKIWGYINTDKTHIACSLLNRKDKTSVFFREIQKEQKPRYHIWSEDNKVGGRTWYSDEVAAGVMVWDTCLVCEDTLKEVLKREAIISKIEQQEMLENKKNENI